MSEMNLRLSRAGDIAGFESGMTVNIIKITVNIMEGCEAGGVPAYDAYARFWLKENDRLPVVMDVSL